MKYILAAVLVAAFVGPANAEPQKITCEQWCSKYRPTNDCTMACLAKPKGLQTLVRDRPN